MKVISIFSEVKEGPCMEKIHLHIELFIVDYIILRRNLELGISFCNFSKKFKSYVLSNK